MSCTQRWKPNLLASLVAGAGKGAAAGAGQPAPASPEPTNMKGKWSECPAFAVGGKYTLTVRNTSDARLESGSGGKLIKLDYLSSAGLPTTQPKSEALTQTQAKDALATAKVHITSSPTGGEIFVDGKFFCNTPFAIKLM